MPREITQREIRDESGEMMREVDQWRLLRHSSGPHRPWTTSDSVRISKLLQSRTRHLVPDEQPRPRGILDTSVVIGLEDIETSDLPIEVAMSAITLAELASGPAATMNSEARGRRQDRLQRTEAAFDPLPFDADAARAYGRVFAAVMEAGQEARGGRAVDLLIAATALAAGLPLYTRNGNDLRALEGLVDVVVV